MTMPNQSLDLLLNQWYADVFRFSFLLSCHTEAAREITFQTFLYAGCDDYFSEDENEMAAKLFSYAFKTCEDYYLRRLRPLPSRKTLESVAAFPISDELWAFLKKPIKSKAAWFLSSVLLFSPDQIGQILHTRPAKIQSLLSLTSAPSSETIQNIVPDWETTSHFSDDLYLRFEERNVKLENKLRSFRQLTDQAVVWAALGLLLLFGAAAWYTQGL